MGRKLLSELISEKLFGRLDLFSDCGNGANDSKQESQQANLHHTKLNIEALILNLIYGIPVCLIIVEH